MYLHPIMLIFEIKKRFKGKTHISKYKKPYKDHIPSNFSFSFEMR